MSVGNESWIFRRKKKLQTTLDTYVKLKPSASFALCDGNKGRYPLKERQNGAFPRSKQRCTAKALSAASVDVTISEGFEKDAEFKRRNTAAKFQNSTDSGFNSNISMNSTVTLSDSPASATLSSSPEKFSKQVLKLVFDQLASKTPEATLAPSSSCVIYVKETPVIIVKPKLCVDKAVNVPDSDEIGLEDNLTKGISSASPLRAKNSTFAMGEEPQPCLLYSPKIIRDSQEADDLTKNRKAETVIDLTGSESDKELIKLVPDLTEVDEASSIRLTEGLSTDKEGDVHLHVASIDGEDKMSPSLAPKFSVNDSIFNESYNCFKATSERAPFAYKSDAIRGKDERKKLCGYACNCCKAYFNALDLPSDEKERRICAVSRHRDIQAPPATPDHFWEVGFPSTAELLERRQNYHRLANDSNDTLSSGPVNRLYTRKRLC